MDIKAENTQRIKELEAEFSDEKIAEIFRVDENGRPIYARQKKKSRFHLSLRQILVLVIVAVVIYFLFQFYRPMVIGTDSMQDMLNARDCVFVENYAFASLEVAFGDVVMHSTRIEKSNGGAMVVCNRIIGLPGDEIEIRNGSVRRNGVVLEEAYVKGGTTEGYLPLFKVPDDYFFVLSDNRQESLDSRDARIGFITMKQIKGRAFYRILPLSRAGDLTLA